MFNKALLMSFAKKVDGSRNTLSFVASNDGSGIDFFKDISSTYHPDSAFTVKINGETTDQNYRSLSFVAGDKVKITCDDGFSFPTFKGDNHIGEISPLPLMTSSSGSAVTVLERVFLGSYLTSVPEDLFINNTSITNIDLAFSLCKSLTSVPENLLANNVEVDSVNSLFSGCSKLDSIPEKLFANNKKITNFYQVFKSCTSLTSVPENLFESQTSADGFVYAFSGCSNLSGRIRIYSEKVKYVNSFCNGCQSMTVIVPAGSTTETTFRNYAATVTNLTVETF